MSSEQAHIERLREIAKALPRAAYPHPDLAQVHALEDEAATLLGKRTVRQADDVVSPCQLYRLLQAAVAAPAPKAPRPHAAVGSEVPEALRAAVKGVRTRINL